VSRSGPSSPGDPRPIRRVSRVLGRIRGSGPGPTLVAIGGVHGNEPAGVLGIRKVLERLRGMEGELRGDFLGLAGNRAALARGRRFLRRDLNRVWTEERVRKLVERASVEEVEDEAREQWELLEMLEEADRDARGEVFVMDIHTTSSMSGPWATIEDTLRSRAFALDFPIPIILGLEEQVDGTLLEHVSRKGHVMLVFEAGQHGDPRSVDRTEAAIWTALGAAGVLRDPRRKEVLSARRELTEETAALPRVLEMRYRHPVVPGDRFRMRPGYVNLQPIDEEEVLARDRSGMVRAPEGGRVLMPLYQEQGEDGFFVVREFDPFWLRVSEVLRRIRAGRIAHWLPGVRRHPDRDDTLVVNRKLARWYALEILHLLGYRKQRERGDVLIVQGHPRENGR